MIQAAVAVTVTVIVAIIITVVVFVTTGGENDGENAIQLKATEFMIVVFPRVTLKVSFVFWRLMGLTDTCKPLLLASRANPLRKTRITGF